MDPQQLLICDKIQTTIACARKIQYQIRHDRDQIEILKTKIFKLVERKCKTYWRKRFELQKQIKVWQQHIKKLKQTLDYHHECRLQLTLALGKLQAAENRKLS